jgi:hypothetical protein
MRSYNKIVGDHKICQIHICRVLHNIKSWPFFRYEKASVFNSIWLNDFSKARCRDILATNVLIYTGRRKNETELRKMIKIMEKLLKFEKNEKYRFHMRSHSKKGTESQNHIQWILIVSMFACLLSQIEYNIIVRCYINRIDFFLIFTVFKCIHKQSHNNLYEQLKALFLFYSLKSYSTYTNNMPVLSDL